MEGYIAIHRQIKDNFLWKDKPFSKGQAWIDILLRVNHKPNEVLIGNQVVKVGKGETVWSILDMSKEWGWSRKKVENFLNILENEQMLYNKRTTKYTILTVAKWESYQKSEQQKSNKRATREQQKSTNNNDNNENKKETSDFSDFVRLYPGKKVSDVRDKKLPGLIKIYGKEQMLRTVERYAKEVKGKSDFILNESTFWNGRYKDYLDSCEVKTEQTEFKQVKLVELPYEKGLKAYDKKQG